MADKDVFDRYLEFRLQKVGALTPGQKLEIVKELLREAREEGKVPTSATSVTSLPVQDPVVQAILRGEAVSLGTVSISEKKENDWRDVSTWTTSRKLMVLAVVVVMFMLFAAATMRRGGNKTAAAPTEEATAVVEISPTPDWPATMTAIAQASAPTPPPSTPTVVPFLLLGQGGPAEDSRDPASIEIAGRLFVVSRGQVSKDTGEWEPQGPEWLDGTEVRRVFSIPYADVSDMVIEPGAPISVRTRGGQVLNYRVRDVVRLLANQIETFISLRPSLVVMFPLQPGDASPVERIALFGEAEEPAPVADESASSSHLAPNAYTITGANLRNAPSLGDNVLAGMPAGTLLLVSAMVSPVEADGHVWVYVLSPYGYGWVAQDIIARR